MDMKEKSTWAGHPPWSNRLSPLLCPEHSPTIKTITINVLCQSLTRGQKVQSRRGREICKKVLHFREEKEKWIFFSQVSRGEISVPNSSYKLFFVKIWSKDGRFLGINTRKIQSFCDSVAFYSVIETGTKSQKLRGKRYVFLKSLVFRNLRNWEEKEKFFSESWTLKREREWIKKSHKSRRENRKGF